MYDKDFLKELTVICAEDSKSLRIFMQENMGKLFRKFYALKNGKEALLCYNLLKSKNIRVDAIVSDINMPVLDGIGFLKEIRKIDEKIPFIFTTAYLEKQYLLEAISLNATEYILKPIDVDSAVKKIAHECKFIRQQETIKNQKQELEKYLEIIDSVASISKANPHGVITFVNQNFCDVSQYSKDELMGQNHSILRHPEVPVETFKNLWHTISLGKVWKGKMKNKAKDGSAYYENSTIIPHYDDLKEVIEEYICIKFVVTEEENERREFKKRVMQNIKESRFQKRKYEDYIKKLEMMVKETDGTTAIQFEEKLNSERSKISKLNSQIDYYEKELKLLDEKNQTIVSSSNEKIKKAFDYAKELKSSNVQLGFDIKKLELDIKDKTNELKKLEEHVIEQNKTIKDLRDVIKHREEQLFLARKK